MLLQQVKRGGRVFCPRDGAWHCVNRECGPPRGENGCKLYAGVAGAFGEGITIKCRYDEPTTRQAIKKGEA